MLIEKANGHEYPISPDNIPEHHAFLASLQLIAQALDTVGLNRKDWFVCSGGAVALY